ncbi:MAG: leucine-rich repeat domain-containing protein [Alistipes sp.]|nr:leucine-rich repeat domain-containing protein [Alistipes sp.]
MKKILFAVSAAILINTAWSPTPAAAADSEKNGFVYTIIDNEATITGFQGEPVYIDIPEIVESCRVTGIRDNAFYECGSLKQITLPGTIEKIGHHGFYGCYALESIVIPDSVTEIGMGSFSGCTALSYAALPEGIVSLPESCFRSCTSLKNIIIPDTVEKIGDFCFSSCTSMTSVSLGESVAELGDCAFYMCTSLNSLYIPPSVTDLGFCSVGYIPTNDGAVPNESFTLVGTKNSAAQDYAAENAISFEKAEDSVHAFAIQRINGQRIGVPTIFIIAAFAVPILALLLVTRKKHRKK